MTSRLLLSLSLLFAVLPAGAQLLPAEDFFNGGAQLYISNNIPAALEKVELGRKTYPADEKLKKLEELLKQKQQQQQQNQQQSQNDQQKKSDEQKKQEQQQKQDSQQSKQDQPNQPEQKKDSSDKPKDEKPEPAQSQPVKAGEMTPDEAKRLLDAQKDSEQLLQMKPENKPRDSRRPVKDW